MSFPPGQLRGALQEAGAYPPGREGGNKNNSELGGPGEARDLEYLSATFHKSAWERGRMGMWERGM